MDVNGDERLHPLRAGFPVCDTVGGLNAAFAIMAALFHRERTGRGQAIDVALLDSIMPLMGWVAANLLIGGKGPVPMGNDNFTAAPSGVFRTGDGFINIAANKQEQWEAVTEVLELPELKSDPRFQERDERKKNRKALTPLLEAKLTAKRLAHWVEALNARTCPPARSSRSPRRSPSCRSNTGGRSRCGWTTRSGRKLANDRQALRLAGRDNAPPPARPAHRRSARRPRPERGRDADLQASSEEAERTLRACGYLVDRVTTAG